MTDDEASLGWLSHPNEAQKFAQKSSPLYLSLWHTALMLWYPSLWGWFFFLFFKRSVENKTRWIKTHFEQFIVALDNEVEEGKKARRGYNGSRLQTLRKQ